MIKVSQLTRRFARASGDLGLERIRSALHLDFRGAFLGAVLAGALRLAAMPVPGCDGSDVDGGDSCSMLNLTRSTSFEGDGDGSSLFFLLRDRVARWDIVL